MINRYKFYHSKAWKQAKNEIWYRQNLLCNRCHRPVYVDGLSMYVPKEKRLKGIVHHKEYITDENIYDDNITLNIDNFEGLCIDCHNEEHFKLDTLRDGYVFDEYGQLKKKDF